MPVDVIDLTQSPTIRAPSKPQEIDLPSLLEQTIDDVSAETVKRVLKTLCKEQPLAAKFVESQLLTSESEFKDYNDVSSGEETEESEEDEDEKTSEEDGSDDEKEEGQISKNGRKTAPRPPQLAGKKRMRSRFLMCEQCGVEFDGTLNDRFQCIWHPGKNEFS